jgi:hypothetical protein
MLMILPEYMVRISAAEQLTRQLGLLMWMGALMERVHTLDGTHRLCSSGQMKW